MPQALSVDRGEYFRNYYKENRHIILERTKLRKEMLREIIETKDIPIGLIVERNQDIFIDWHSHQGIKKNNCLRI